MASHYLTGSRQRRGSLLSHPQAAPAPVPLVEPTDVYRAGGPFVLASVGFGAYTATSAITTRLMAPSEA